MDAARQFDVAHRINALAPWPEAGVPDNPGARLTTIAKRKATPDDVLLTKAAALDSPWGRVRARSAAG